MIIKMGMCFLVLGFKKKIKRNYEIKHFFSHKIVGNNISVVFDN